jgi:hypothetical protein
MDDLFKAYLTDGKQETAREAGESIREHVSRLENVVHTAILGAGGLACYEVEQRTGLSHQTASARITGLQHKQLLRDSGLRRLTPSRRRAIVWVSTRTRHDA